MNYSKISSRYVLPDLLEAQFRNFCSLLQFGLIEELNSFSSIIKSFDNEVAIIISSTNFRLSLSSYNFEQLKYTSKSYMLQVKTRVELLNRDDSSKDRGRLIRFCEIPLLTPKGSFLVSGIERVILGQLVRAPGVYFKRGKATIIPLQGLWVKFEISRLIKKTNWINFKIGNGKKTSVYLLLRTLGLEDEQILKKLKKPFFFRTTIDFDREEFELVSSESLSFNMALKALQFSLYPENSRFDSRFFLYSVFFDQKKYDLGYVGRSRLNTRLNINIHTSIYVLTIHDLIGIINNLTYWEFDFKKNLNGLANIDDFGNKRVRLVGELIQKQIRVGLLRVEKTSKYKITNSKDLVHNLPLMELVNTNVIDYAIQEFFTHSPLSQFLDEMNPIASVTHKRRLTFGAGGKHVNIKLRDVNPSQYHKVCVLETPEGSRVGLVGSLATHSRICSTGLIEAPYYKMIRGRIETFLPIYLNGAREYNCRVAFGSVKLGINSEILDSKVDSLFKREFIKIPAKKVNYVALSSVALFSVAASLVPFSQHNDGIRILMSSAHQRQSVPLLYPKRPLICTGFESVIARDSSLGIVSSTDGKVVAIGNGKIAIKDKKGIIFRYVLRIYERSNQGTCIHNRPCVSINQKVRAGQVIADGAAMQLGTTAVGQNVVAAYMPWDGYNFEDALIVNERLIYDHVYSSLKIKRFGIKIKRRLRKKKDPEIITRDLPNVKKKKLLQHLDNNGIVKIGTLVKGGDILVGKVTPLDKPKKPKSGKEKLIDAIFKRPKRPPKFRNTSLKLPYGVSGRVIDVKIFTKNKRLISKEPEEESSYIKNEKILVAVIGVIIFIATISKLQIGDKMSGRHGNKGVIAKIVPREDMPFLEDGNSVDMLINPLGVPSRMNIGQLYEGLLGFAAKNLNVRYRIPPFLEEYGPRLNYSMANGKLKEASQFNKDWLFSDLHPGKLLLRDGRSGQIFYNPIVVCCIYMLKLIHQVEHKIHARSIGPYSIITQQPLRGRSKSGGQRLGEMEVWALQSYGAAYNLRELLTIKSDDLVGRSNTHVAILEGLYIPSPGVPETFKVLIRELQSLCIDVTTHKSDKAKESYYKVNVVN